MTIQTRIEILYCSIYDALKEKNPTQMVLRSAPVGHETRCEKTHIVTTIIIKKKVFL